VLFVITTTTTHHHHHGNVNLPACLPASSLALCYGHLSPLTIIAMPSYYRSMIE